MVQYSGIIPDWCSITAVSYTHLLAEKLAKLFLVLLFLIGIEGIDVHAAVSYPNMLPDAETVGCEIKSGEIAKLKFTVVKGTSYSSVKYFVEVYDSDSKTTKVAESQGAVTENITNLTVEWDTSDVIPGTYTVQYYVPVSYTHLCFVMLPIWGVRFA